jgi:ribosome-associated toxin RatA of RatAB toxin-antitoxin module
MVEPNGFRVVRSSPGRLRLHAPALSAAGDAGTERIAALAGVREVHLSPHTGTVLIEFDQGLIDEPDLIALIADDPAPARPSRKPRRPTTDGPGEGGWLRAERSETIYARPADCIAALLEFERYPEWQAYLTAVSVQKRDVRGRGVRVRTQATIAEREIEFTTSYRYPSPNRVLFAQDDGELDAVQGSWAFRSSGGGRTRATFALEVKPGWRFSVLLRGSLYERIRDAVLDHFMDELRARVEPLTED